MHLKKLCLIFLIFASCNRSAFSSATGDLYRSYSKEMKQKHNLHLSATGTGARIPHAGLTEIYLDYTTFAELDIEKGRVLYIEIVEGLVQKINQDVKIREHLAIYPFTWRNTVVGLASLGANGRHIQGGGKIAFIAVKGDDILYAERDPAENRLNLVFREPYEEALRIVQQSKCN